MLLAEIKLFQGKLLACISYLLYGNVYQLHFSCILKLASKPELDFQADFWLEVVAKSFMEDIDNFKLLAIWENAIQI